MPQPALSMMAAETSIQFPVCDYDLDATMTSGQVFAWEKLAGGWHGILAGRHVVLTANATRISATAGAPQTDWQWLRHFLQVDVDLASLLQSFPADDIHLQAARQTCRGLRLLRQEPWECLASFILSSTKQIVQIRQIVRLLRERHGAPVVAPNETILPNAFPTPDRIARLTEADLRACKMGFRAKYLLTAAQRVANGTLDLKSLEHVSIEEARAALMTLPGVGEKIADCVLLFAYGFPEAFPIDVWVARALSQFYFRGRKVHPDRLRRFATKHFGAHSGYAQQYLFHHIRTQLD